jgi:methylated-DNA-[protein]-cysteine S-methyltransferase
MSKLQKFLRDLPGETSLRKTSSPLGTLTLLACPNWLRGLLWDSDWHEKQCAELLSLLPTPIIHPVLDKSVAQLKEYFRGERYEFNLPLKLHGTQFQNLVWKELQNIPYGHTISYSEQAKRLGDIKKVRAVAGANGRNPISIIVPCHRVLNSKGQLHGFGGGPERKRLLLEIERNNGPKVFVDRQQLQLF